MRDMALIYFSSMCYVPSFSLSDFHHYSERQLHTRIKKWKIGRNHKADEMETAAGLLARYQDQQQHIRQSMHPPANIASTHVEKPSFLIRGEKVSHEEFKRYFRRKKISDPVSWFKKAKDDTFVLSQDVQIITEADIVSGDSSSSDENEQKAKNKNVPLPDLDDLSHVQGNYSDEYELVTDDYIDAARGQEAPSTLALQHTNNYLSQFSVPEFIRPQSFSALERLADSMSKYMASYLSPENTKTDHEPTLHAHTLHAIFASKMQDGVSILSRVPLPDTAERSVSRRKRPHPTAEEALVSFNNGFDKIQRILANHSPMSLALMLSVVCELASHATTAKMNALGVNALLLQLLQYTHKMATTVLKQGHPLTELFHILGQEFMFPTTPTSTDSPPLVDLIFTAFRVAIERLQSLDHQYALQTRDWRQLYLRERFCDALYYSGLPFQPTRADMRKQLLFDQELKYGQTARNVMWTLTNVADDCLAVGDVDAAIGWFTEALRRADTLTEEYGKAKTRFAALEGLGRCWLAKARAEPLAHEVSEMVGVTAILQGQHHHNHRGHQHLSTSPASRACSAGTRSPAGCSCTYHSTASSTGTSTPNSRPTASHSHFSSPSPSRSPRTNYLHKAKTFFEQAENEANLYFEPSSRRTARVSQRRLDVVEMLGLMTPESGASSVRSSLGLDIRLGSASTSGEASDSGVEDLDLNSTANQSPGVVVTPQGQQTQNGSRSRSRPYCHVHQPRDQDQGINGGVGVGVGAGAPTDFVFSATMLDPHTHTHYVAPKARMNISDASSSAPQGYGNQGQGHLAQVPMPFFGPPLQQGTVGGYAVVEDLGGEWNSEVEVRMPPYH